MGATDLDNEQELLSRALSAPHLSQLLDECSYGVLIWSRISGVQLWNRWLEEKTGIGEGEAVSRRITDLFPALAGTEFSRQLDRQTGEDGAGFVWSPQSHGPELGALGRALGQGGGEAVTKLICRPMSRGKNNLCWLEVHSRDRSPRTWAGDGRQTNFPVQLESAELGIVTIDNYGFIQAINGRLSDILGYEVAELLDKPVRLIFPELVGLSGNENYRELLENLIRRDRDHLLNAVTVDGRPAAFDVQVFDNLDTGNQWTFCCRDVTHQKGLQESLHRQREILAAIYSHTADAILILDKRGYLENINPVGTELLGLGHRRHGNLHIDDVLILKDTNGGPVTPWRDALFRERPVGLANSVVLELAGANPVSMAVNASPVRDRSNRVMGCVLVMRAVSEARRISSRLTWQETHDPLTQQANRRQIENEVIWAIDDARANDSTHGLLYLDIYNFTMINDTCGHAAGDELLRQFAGLLAREAGDRDVVARTGNDEFAVLVWGATPERVMEKAERLMELITSFTLPWHDRRLKVGASIGVELITREIPKDMDILLGARTSCRVAWENGRNRIHFPGKGKEVQYRQSVARWATSIAEALDEDRFAIYCQPIVKLSGIQDVKHYEVLVRMIDRDGSIIPPGNFIPAAETSGLIDDVDKWVFEKVLENLEKIPPENRVQYAFSVNLSGNTISDEKFLDHVVARIRKARVEPGVLKFEVTETAAVKHFDRAIHFITTLNKLGCNFSLDDFGSGLSSFGYLKQLPVNYLKIDGSFVSKMEVEDIDYSMVSTINHLAHVMGLETIAESVENQAQASLLREIGVDHGQGFFFAPPEPIERVLQV